jgi:hypothetical protein
MRARLSRSHLEADRVRFELTIPLPVCRFSRPVPSTTRPPVQERRSLVRTLACVNEQDSRPFGCDKVPLRVANGGASLRRLRAAAIVPGRIPESWQALP